MQWYTNSEMMDMINERRSKTDALIAVSHFEIVNEFPEFFSRSEFGKSDYFGELLKGQAVYFGLESESSVVLPR